MEQRVQIYIKQAFSLAKSIVFKSDLVARLMNESLVPHGVTIDINDRTTWRYYLHLAGEYHPIDNPMTVISLDTQQPIAFTKSVLNNHRVTLQAYRSESSFYEDLVAEHPGQQDLIDGILQPLDLHTVIDAPDGTILRYRKDMVDGNEVNLIPLLTQWIEAALTRHLVPAVSFVDNLYVPAFLAILYMQMPAAIMNIRLKNCHSWKAHHFHVREYLASHQYLDEYFNYMTLDQRLFLYRNILYIQRHGGKTNTFDFITEHLLTRRGLALVKYDLLQNHTQVPQEALYPTLDVIGNYLNFPERDVDGFKERIDTLVYKENVIAIGNRSVADEAVVHTDTAVINGLTTQYATKVLESRTADDVSRQEITLPHMLINHWLYLGYHGLYSTLIAVRNPVSGLVQSLSILDGFKVYWYCYMKALGITLPTIPRFLALDVQRLTLPTKAEFRSITEAAYVQEDYLNLMIDRVRPYQFYDQQYKFYDAIKQAHRAYLLNTWMYKARRDPLETAFYKNIQRRFYTHRVIETADYGESYPQWLYDRGIVVDDFTKVDYAIFAEDLLREFTGYHVLEENDVRKVQEAMVAIMRRLSSYNVQYLTFLESDNYMMLDWMFLKPSRPDKRSFRLQGVETGIGVQETDHRSRVATTIALPRPDLHNTWSMSHRLIPVTLDVKIQGDKKSYDYRSLQGSTFRIHEVTYE